jgi:hypothetical protein
MKENERHNKLFPPFDRLGQMREKFNVNSRREKHMIPTRKTSKYVWLIFKAWYNFPNSK